MKILFVAGIFTVICCSNCGRTDRKTLPETKPATVVPSWAGNVSGCYQMIIDADTATMNIVQQLDSVTGSLEYRRVNKKNTIGQVWLKRDDSLHLTGWYNILDTGSYRHQQIRFKLVDNGLAEAYGSLHHQQDSLYFEFGLDVLKYEENHPYIKSACKN